MLPDPAAGSSLAAPATRRPLGYLVVGGISFALDTGLLVLLREVAGLALPVATTAGFLAGLAANFALNRSLVFRGGSGAARHQLLRYLVLVAANLAITLAIVTGLAAFAVPYPVAKTIATATLVLANYTAYRRWVFT